MPFDLFISQAPSFDRIDKGGLFRPSDPITMEQFRGVMEGGAPTVRADGDLWIRHPEDATPWLAARLSPKGSIILSCSYSNHRYLRNFADAFDLGLKIAEALSANLFEEVRSTSVTRKNIDALLDPRGDYVRLQASTFKHIRERLDQDPGGPLEYPLGPIDLVFEYCVFHLELPASASTALPEYFAQLPSSLYPDSSSSDTHALLCDNSDKPLVKILLRPDRKLQIWPMHGYAAFSESAGAVLQVVEALSGAFSATPFFNFSRVDDPLLVQLHNRVAGLGVEFYEWVTRERTEGV